MKHDDDDLDELLLGQVRRFAKGLDSAAIERDGMIRPELRDQAAELGLFAFTLPEAHGGLGLSLAQTCTLIASVAEADRSVATLLGLHAGLGTQGVVRYACPSFASTWLPLLASGTAVGAFAATEAGAGSDLMAIRTTGRLKGSSMHITGEKCYVTNGGFAGLFTVLVRAPDLGARAHALVCVPADAVGLSIGREESKLGIKASSTVTVSFDDVRVPLDNILSPTGQGMQQAHEVLRWGRTLMSAGCVGTTRAALDQAMAHIKTRRQFGRPLAAFEAVRAQVCTMASTLYAAEALVERTAQAADRPDFDLLSMIAKVICSEGAFRVCDRSLQLHGALGFLEDLGIARLARDCRVTRIFEGANDVLLVRAATALLAAPPAARLKGRTSAHALATEAARLRVLESELLRTIETLRKQHGIQIIHKQSLLQGLAHAYFLYETAYSAFLRASDGDRGDRLLASHAIDTCVREAEVLLHRLSCRGTASIETELFASLCGSPIKPSAQDTPDMRDGAVVLQAGAPCV